MEINTRRIAATVAEQAPEGSTPTQIAYEAAEQAYSEALNQSVVLREALIRVRSALYDEGYSYPNEMITECNLALGFGEDAEPDGSPDDLTEYDLDDLDTLGGV